MASRMITIAEKRDAYPWMNPFTNYDVNTSAISERAKTYLRIIESIILQREQRTARPVVRVWRHPVFRRRSMHGFSSVFSSEWQLPCGHPHLANIMRNSPSPSINN